MRKDLIKGNVQLEQKCLMERIIHKCLKDCYGGKDEFHPVRFQGIELPCFPENNPDHQLYCVF